MSQLMLDRFHKRNDNIQDNFDQKSLSEKELVQLWNAAISSDIQNGVTEYISQLLRQGNIMPDHMKSILDIDIILESGREDILKLIIEGIIVDAVTLCEVILGEKIVELAEFKATVKSSIRIENQKVSIYEFLCHTPIETNLKCVEWMRKKLSNLGLSCFYKQNKERTGYDLCFFYSTEPLAILWYYQPSSRYYELTAKEIRGQIEQWNQKYGVEILGAGADFVELRFLNLSCEMKDFHLEASEFCPQLVLLYDFFKACSVKEDNQVEILFCWN